MRLLQRIRSTLGTALTWSAAFAAVGVVGGVFLGLGLTYGFIPPPPGEHASPLVLGMQVVARWAIVGALSGIAFSIAVMIAERRQYLETLSARRFGWWGFLAGALGTAGVVTAFVALLPIGFVAGAGWSLAAGLGAIPIVGGMLGRVTAAATLRAARRGMSSALPAAPGQLQYSGTE
jgi:hypothetical protein